MFNNANCYKQSKKLGSIRIFDRNPFSWDISLLFDVSILILVVNNGDAWRLTSGHPQNVSHVMVGQHTEVAMDE